MFHKLQRLWRSLSFRIIMVLLLLIWVMAWCFTVGFSNVIMLTTSSREGLGMSNIVSWQIQNKLSETENTLQLIALATRGRHLSEYQLNQLVDSIQSLKHNTREVYVLPQSIDIPELDTLRPLIFEQRKMMWSQVYLKADSIGRKSPTVTCMMPLARQLTGDPYAILCCDYQIAIYRPNLLQNACMNSDLQEIMEIFNTDAATITLTDSLGRYISHPDSTYLLKYKSDADFSFSEVLFPVHQQVKSMNWDLQYIVDWANKDTARSRIIRGVIFVFCGFLFSFLCLAVTLVVHWQVKPLKKIAEAAEMVSKGYFDTPLPKIWGNTEIKQLRNSFELMQEHLVKYIADLKVSTERNAMMDSEMSIASDIQQGMIPKIFPAFVNRTDLDIYGLQTPARQVGGDLYDFFIYQNKLFFCIGDVSGKGVPAALFMTVVGHLFRHVGRHTMSPSVIVESINIGLCQGNKRNMFCTLFCGILDLETHQLLYTNGGHNAPVIIRKEEQPEFLQTQVCLPCGAFEEARYVDQQIQFNPGDSLFLYTDGITEAENFNRDFFGEEAMMQTLATTPVGCTMEQMVSHMMNAIDIYTQGAEQSDDITMLSIKLLS